MSAPPDSPASGEGSAQLRAFAEETEPSASQQARVAGRVRASLKEREAEAGSGSGAGSEAGSARASGRGGSAGLWAAAGAQGGWKLALGGGLAGAALAGALLLLVTSAPVERLDLKLDGRASLGPTDLVAAQPVAGLDLQFAGAGVVEGSSRRPRVRWNNGRLQVAVDPAAGLAVSVVTAEAQITVVGTTFSVDRGPLGTHVAVERGEVRVLCDPDRSAAAPLALRGGEETRCLPLTPPGLLARARALQTGGAEAAAVLAAADAGLAQAPASRAIATELRLVRVEALRSAGQREDALQAARDLLDSGQEHRRVDALRLAAALAWGGVGAEGCAPALPYLEQLAEKGATDGELLRLADCVEGSEPARAAQLRSRVGPGGDSGR